MAFCIDKLSVQVVHSYLTGCSIKDHGNSTRIYQFFVQKENWYMSLQGCKMSSISISKMSILANIVNFIYLNMLIVFVEVVEEENVNVSCL